MARDGSGVYHRPVGTDAVTDTTIESTKYNINVADVEQDLNTPRPIVAGGTGATSPAAALLALSGETAKQVVTNYDSQVWLPGSFYSATTALGTRPVAGHAFAGIVYYVNATDLACEATDLADPANPTKYIRIMSSGIWSPWMLASGSAATTGDYTFDSTLTFPPASGQIRFNNAVENSTTEVFISHLTALGADNTGLITASIKSGYTLFIQDKDEPTKYKTFVTTANPVLSGGDFRVTVTFVSGGVDIVSAQRVLLSASTGSAVCYDIAQTLTDTQQAQARQNIYAASFDAMAYSGMQVNGAMEISQERGMSNLKTVNGYLCDGWQQYFTPPIVLNATAAPMGAGTIPNFPNYMEMAVSTPKPSLAATDLALLFQSIEGCRTARLAFGTSSAIPITIAFWSAHYATGVYAGCVQNQTTPGVSNRSYVFTYTHNAIDTWQFNVVTIPGDAAGVWKTDNTASLMISFPLAAGSTFLAPAANVWTAGDFRTVASAINGVASALYHFRITGVVVLPGAVQPTASNSRLIRRSYGEELVTCQRYWENGQTSFIGYSAAGSFLGFWIPFHTSKRAAPTLNGAPVTVTNATALSWDTPTIDGCRETVNVTATGSASVVANWTADARLP